MRGTRWEFRKLSAEMAMAVERGNVTLAFRYASATRGPKLNCRGDKYISTEFLSTTPVCNQKKKKI